MPNTPNYNLYYPSSTESPAAFPAAQKTSQETLDTLLKQISDSIPAGNTSTLNSAKAYTDQAVAETQRTTGLRNITSLITGTTVESGELRIVRTGSLVNIMMRGLTVSSSGSASLFTVPNGFRPIGSSVRDTLSDSSSRLGYAEAYGSGSFWCQRLGSGIAMNLLMAYITAQPFPNEPYPGIPS